MNLQRKGEAILHGAFKAILFFVVAGALVLLVAVYFVQEMIGDITTAIASPEKVELKTPLKK